jgi:hypothetical protein
MNCAYCGEEKARFGTTVDARLVIEDGTYAISPAFCSWQHAAAWFNQPPPDVSQWTLLREPERVTVRAEGGLWTWIVCVVLVLLLLGVAVVLGSTLS